jgi:hypothetical protein
MSREVKQGEKFGRLTVLGLTKVQGGRTKANCKCDCGSIKLVLAYSLKDGNTQSCGCLQRERTSAARKTHGHTVSDKTTAAYQVWTNMLTRCNNPKATRYAEYGARGIRVCEHWMKFENFLSDMGEPSHGMTIDRINNDGDYAPSNCRWVTQTEQCRNRRSNRAVIRNDGVHYRSMADAAEAIDGTIGGIWSTCNGDQKVHRGFGWRYA